MEHFSQQVLLSSRIKIRQHYKYDCGAACLASIAAFYGISISMAHIRMICGCTPQGISVQGIIDGAVSLGFQANGYRSNEKDIHQLKQLQLPVIAHTKDENGYLHYVVIYSLNRKHLRIMDPADGILMNMPVEEFSSKWSGYFIRVVPSATLTCTGEAAHAGHFILKLLKGNKKELLLAFAGTVICICTGMVTTMLLQQIIDVIIPSGERNLLWIAVPAVGMLMILSLVVGYCATKRIISCSIKVESSLIAAYIWKLFKLPAPFYDNYTAGDISSRTDDIHLIRSFITGGTIGMAASVITLVTALTIMLVYNFQMAIMVLCFLPVYITLYWVAEKTSSRWGKAVAAANSAFESSLLEGVASVQSIRHYNAAGKASMKIEEKYITLAEMLQKSAFAVTGFEISVQGVSRLLVCMVLCIGTLTVFNGHMTLGELVGFYSLCSFFTVPLDDMTSSISSMAKAKVAIKRIYEILSIKDNDKAEGKISPIGLDADIKIKALKFKYPGREMLFNGIYLYIEQGKITRIEGGNGRGKSTLLKLITGDYAPIEGSISYGGINIHQFNQVQWKNNIGYVEQRPSILNASILENIVMGDNNPCIERVLEICRELNMTDMIERFPQGLLTNAGGGGYSLSGGECQKIGIARALYKDPRIYILDEATSSMDSKNEEYVAECIHKLRDKGKTIILVSHKKESSIIADNVVNIDKAGLEW